ncbi:MAG: hypothetical protein ACOCWR_05955 [Oceanidesulfovibrio sp.]
MRALFFLLLILALAVPAAAGECTFSHRHPVTAEGRELRVFVNECGQRYEVGYRLDGATLLFPSGGRHTVTNLPQDEAQVLLRKTYGLQGQGDALVRTKWTR